MKVQVENEILEQNIKVCSFKAPLKNGIVCGGYEKAQPSKTN